MSFEEEYVDVFHNVESAIVGIYQEKPDLLDAQVETAIDYLIRVYNAEAQGRHAPRKSIRGISSEVASQLQALCELHLGRAEVEDLEGKPIELEITQRTAEEITACLKRIKSSVKLWTKQRGRQGYLNFITEFINEKIRAGR